MIDVEATARAEEFAARWMKWVAGTSVVNSPLLDESGEDAGRKQPADVWFLGGTMGGAAQREFNVPLGRPLFGPAFCMWSPAPLALSHMEHAWGTVRVDGQDLDTIRAATSKVRIRGALGNPVTQNFWPASRYVVGVWAMIQPLAAGTHVLEIAGTNGYGFKVSVHATIHVS
ncbi:hypothetical protein [Promicromonospora sp. NPDC023805]|uniref:hypothetical protein n=1 Tax=Promicromonospora sp. NPDC023805 TaxID=3154696 RepID=UPI0033C7C9C5